MAQTSDITFYYLGASRAIRVAWLLEELDLEYKLVASPRAPNGLAPPEFKQKMGTKIGKSPTITDHGITIQESGAITEYLCENYDPSHRLIPQERIARAKVREWIAASEGTFMIHGLAVLYARWQMPEGGKNDDILGQMEKKLSVNVQKDFDWLDFELQSGNGKYLVGDSVTAADTMMGFSAQFIMARKLGTGDRTWPAVEAWVKHLEGLKSYKKAVEKTGHSL